MIKTLRTLYTLTTLLLGACVPAFGQVSYDQSTGRYTIMVYDDAGHLVPMTIPSPGRVKATAVGSATPLPDNRFRYLWTVQVEAQSPDPLGDVWVPCPTGARVDTILFTAPFTHGRVVNGEKQQEERVQHCQSYMRVNAGDSIQITLITNYLPAFGEIRLQGFVRGASWPTSDPSSDNDRFARTVDSLSGLDATGVHVTIPSVVSIRPPSTLSQPDVAINVLLSDLGQACSKGWVSPRGVCQSLEVKLTSAKRSLASGNRNAAVAQIHAFRQELSNQGRMHISSEAASVLDITAMWIESHL